ncbi:MAG: S8 family serine peptidase [Pseudonocardiaceae bacterium]
MTGGDQEIQLRLLVDAGQAASTTRQDLGDAARAALGAGWAVTRLFPHSPDPLLARHWVITGQVPVSPVQPFAPLAYDLAATLAERLGSPVEPDLPSSAFGIEPPEDGLTRAAADGAAAKDLPGSAEKDWALRKIAAQRAWERALPPGGSSRGRGVLIGHIDTGYTDHPDLERSALDLTRDLDVVDGDDDARDPLIRRWWWPLDSPGHGTRTGSVIASRVTREIVGTAPEATLLPVRAVRSVVQVFDVDVARAVDHARRSGCQVITMSLGGRGFVGLRDAITRAVADGIIVMAAAGNQVRFVVAPAVYPECLAVAASNADDRPWTGSSRGDAVDISAPGESVWIARVDSSVQPPRYDSRRSNGTSFAVAHLAGVAALWLAFHGPDTIRHRYGRERVQAAFLSLVRSTCRRPDGWDHRQYGAGIVNADALLAASLPSTAPDDLPAAPEFDPLRRITAALPELSRPSAVTGLASRFAVEESALPEVLRRHSSELVYLLGENVDLSDVLRAPTPGLSLAARDGPAATPLMSRHLAAALAGHQ